MHTPEETKIKKQTVLDELRYHASISIAAARARISRKTIWQWRQNDKVFAAGVDQAIKVAKGDL